MYRGKKIESISAASVFSNNKKDYSLTKLSSTTSIEAGQTRKNITKYKIVPNNDQNAAEDYLSDFEQIEYEYYNAILYQPIDEREEIKNSERYPTYRFRDIFNYRPEAYIKYSSTLQEEDIPNFYLSKEDEGNDKYLDNFCLNSDIQARSIFQDVNTFKSSRKNRTLEEISRTSTMVMTRNTNQYSSKERDNFPFAIDFVFNFKDRNSITNLLDKQGMHESLIDYLKTAAKKTTIFKETQKDFDYDYTSTSATEETLDFDEYLKTCFYQKYYNFILLPDVRDSSIFIHNIKKIETIVEILNMRENTNPYSFDDINSKRKTPSELLYLKVEKFSGKNDLGTPIQTIYLSGNNEVYRYFDTQVKNRKYYTYKVTGIFLLSGVKYNFKHLEDNTIELHTTRVNKIIEYPILSKHVYVMQPLQLPPKVLVYKDKNKNKVYFHIRLNNENTRYVPFEKIVENDKNTISILENTKQYENPEHSYTVESARFEIFKTTVRPKSLKDLENSFLLETKILRDRMDHLFIDNIEYEKDYYYLFRTINSEGFPGNPTKVYKVRIQKGIEENKAHFEELDFTKVTEEYDVKKNFDKLMHIYPNENQIIMTNLNSINGDTFEGKLNEVNVGLELNNPTKVWGKKFKLRVTSNNTGKKIDFNIKFSIKRKSI